ncbi:MAG: hypothetical protein KTR25_20745 [Myxococcales bacterium]|nr:hypothetical protein [Myxococcales bacterium]
MKSIRSFVLRMFRPGLLRWTRPPRRAIPTLPGLFALVSPLFLGLAAVTATNNLLFLLLGATLGSVVLSGVLSERNIQPISVRLRGLEPAYVGRPVRLEVRFCRPPNVIPAFDLRFREAPNIIIIPRWTFIPKPPQVLDVHMEVVDGEEGSKTVERIFTDRGLARLPLCELSTRYPFGLLVKSKDVTPSLEIWVRPRPVICPSTLLHMPGVRSDQGVSVRKGQGVDVYALRERNHRDSIHRVHALRSLALGREVVLEMTDIEQPAADIGVATALSADAEAMERALELAQSALQRWRSEGYLVGLTTFSQSFRPGDCPLSVLLDHLAQVEPEVAWSNGHCPRVWLVPEGAVPPMGTTPLYVSSDGSLRQGVKSAV